MCRCFSNHKHVSFQELFKFSELFVCMVPLSLVRTLGTVIVATNATHLSVTEKTTKYTAAENVKNHMLNGTRLHSLSLRFNGHFPGEPGLASVY